MNEFQVRAIVRQELEAHDEAMVRLYAELFDFDLKHVDVDAVLRAFRGEV